MIENISNTQRHTSFYSAKTQRVSTTAEQRFNGKTDSVSITGTSSSLLTYSSSLMTSVGADSDYSVLQNLVVNLLEEQGVNTRISIGNAEIDLASISPEEANELVSEDGYFGVEQTSERIFQFAVSISGGDTSKIDAIIAGIEDGFQRAYEALGDWLPDISYDTYDAVMDKLENWAAESATDNMA
ncbi:MAG: hypothetical protein CSA32_02560 [Desulfobulbus propionicus]|nr:MAG: hypothetical protein CSA32_02560 [Desulfobulbus propionicus]